MDGMRILTTSSKPWSQELASFYWKRSDHKYISSFPLSLSALRLESSPRHGIKDVTWLCATKTVYKKQVMGHGEMAQGLRALAALPTDLGSVPQFQGILNPLLASAGTHIYMADTHICK